MTQFAHKILWADDEIDLLKPHIMFLDAKGYEVTPVNNAVDAVERVEEGQVFDIVFLDESMPGMTGLEALAKIKEMRPNLPVVMITKNEEEQVMEEAIGAKISDYLIKPINPNQVLMALKKLLENKRIVSEKTNQGYQQDFTRLSMAYNDIMDHQEWADVYRKLVYWELEIDQTEHKSMKEVLEMQKGEANSNFVRFVKDNYVDWLHSNADERPLLSHDLMSQKVFPHLDDNKPVFFIVIDNLRLDQWKVLEPLVMDYYSLEEDSTYYSILPTTTAYARNAIFSGMMPLQMAQKHKDLWKFDDEEGSKNNHEAEFLEHQLKNKRINAKYSYHKILNNEKGKAVTASVKNLMNNDLNVLVYNFVDMLSHARTDMQMIKELAVDESAYRSLTKSWFEHSPLFDLLKRLRDFDAKVVISTDHGTTRVRKPVRLIGDRNTNTNLRYKQGKNLSHDDKSIMEVRKPEDYFLPKRNMSTSYAFATEDHYFVYPNNYNYYANFYKDTFQHGGVSLEEVIIPVITLSGR